MLFKDNIIVMDVLNLIVSFAGGIIVPVVIVYWGYKVFWSQFKIQKRIENLCQNSKEALGYLINVEELIRNLEILKDKTISEYYRGHDFEHRQIHNELLHELNKLQGVLLLLRKDEDLQSDSQVSEVIQRIENLKKILKKDYKNLSKSFCTIDFLDDVKALSLDKLRETLVLIYHIGK